MKKRPPAWDLVSALHLIRELQPWAFKNGFNLHLGGGVLDHGWSTNDLDVLAMPRAQNPWDWPPNTSEECLMQCVRGWRADQVDETIPHRRIITYGGRTDLPPWELIFVRL